jgi:hypothetical protein
MAELIGTPYSQTLPSTFDVAYPDNPWANITTKERLWYDPILRDVYRQRAVFGQFTMFAQNLANRNAKTMQITSLYDIHPNFDQIGLRDMWMPASHVDSRALQITFGRYGGKVAYHAYDEIINYWEYNGGNSSALRRIINDKLGQHMIDVQDFLSRNALLGVPHTLFANDKTSFADLSLEDKATTSALNEIHLGMKYRGVPYAQSRDGSVGNIVCITSPGVIFDLQQQTDPKDWLVPMAYADPSRLLNYEVGTYRNVRFVETPKMTLFNCGAIIVQAVVSAAINAGDGSPDPATTKVDQTYMVGQPASTHYVQLASGTSAGDMAKFKVNDYVTVHVQRTSDFGVTNGVDYRDGKLHNRRIVAVDTVNKRLSFDQPIMIDIATLLTTATYAYVTKAVHVHAMIFVGGSDGIVMGIGRPPRLHAPGPVDDFDSIFRFSWDSYQGYGVYNPAVLEVLFVGGNFRMVGAMALQG